MATNLADGPVTVAAATRAKVLGLLRTTARPLSAAKVAEATGLHLNTARFHLDALVNDGLAERTFEPRDVPSRGSCTPDGGRCPGRAATRCSPRSTPMSSAPSIAG